MSSRSYDVFEYIKGDFLINSNNQDGQRRAWVLYFYFLKMIRKFLIATVPSIYLGLTGRVCLACGGNSIFNVLFGGFRIPCFYLIFWIPYKTITVEIPKLQHAPIFEPLYIGLVFVTAIFYLAVQFMPAQRIDDPDTREMLNQKLAKDPRLADLKDIKCQRCQTVHIIRSYHCVQCDAHYAKFHEHSFTFNKCIAAGNTLPYVMYHLFAGLVLFFTSVETRFALKDEFKPTKWERLGNNVYFVLILLFALEYIYEFVHQMAYVREQEEEVKRIKCIK